MELIGQDIVYFVVVSAIEANLQSGGLKLAGKVLNHQSELRRVTLRQNVKRMRGATQTFVGTSIPKF